jgi:hypothetical protein
MDVDDHAVDGWHFLRAGMHPRFVVHSMASMRGFDDSGTLMVEPPPFNVGTG